MNYSLQDDAGASMDRLDIVTSHEQLLNPALQLILVRGELEIAEAIAALSARYSFPTDPQAHRRGHASPAFSLVAAAFDSLRIAGLVERKRPYLWSISATGQTLASTAPAEVTFDTLKQYQSYNDHWASVARDNRRHKFMDLRFEHYTGGRLLVLQGSHTAAAVLLAYSIEYHLKAALIEVEANWTAQERKLVESRHELRNLYRACVRHRLIPVGCISLEFLHYAEDHFRRRYPRNEQALMNERGYWSFGGALLNTYDDCIIQLDRVLASFYGVDQYRLTVHALTDASVSSLLVDALFHANVFAANDIQLRGTAPASHVPHRLDQAPVDVERLFFRDGLPPPALTFADSRELLDWHLAAHFRYPKRNEPDPDPARLLSKRDSLASLGITASQWAVDRATAVFGRGAVEVREDEQTGNILLTVFDRRAEDWHASLILRDGIIQLFRNKSNELRVEQWVAECQSQFGKRSSSNV